MSFEHCMRCTVCVENCPVAKVEPRFPGPKQAGPDAQRFRLDGEKSVDAWVNYCSHCMRCQVACPYGVEVADIILKARLKYSKEHFSPLSSHLFANAYHLSKMGSLAAPVMNKITPLPVFKQAMGLLGVSDVPDLPEFRFLSLERTRRSKGRGRRVVFFHGCHLNFNRPDIGRKAIDLLVAFGCRVAIPRQQCCGLPALGNGDLEMARKFALKNASMLTRYVNRGFDVVYSCPSCGLTLTREYPGILDVPGARKVAENTYHIFEYLLPLVQDRLDAKGLRSIGRVEASIAYHVPCHLRALGIGYPSVGLFEMIDGLSFTVLDNDCCGLSGTYGFKKRNRGTAAKLGAIAAGAVRETGCELVVSDCGACRIHLGHYAAMPAMDPVEIVADAVSSGPLAKKRRTLAERVASLFPSIKGGTP